VSEFPDVFLDELPRIPLVREGVTIMVSEPGYETVGSKDLTCEDWMVNTSTDADLSATVQNALQTLLPQIHAEIREEFRTSTGPSDAGRNPPPVTIHTWLERFNKQKPIPLRRRQLPWTRRIRSLTWRRSLMLWVVKMHLRQDWLYISLRFLPRAEQELLKREYHSIRQTNTKTSTEFMQHFLRLAGFLGAAAGTEEEQAKNFQWGLRRDDEDTERPDKR
nr:hypothetical protein [Tanacetum cinerariifolium]